jgi:hypothetical protein
MEVFQKVNAFDYMDTIIDYTATPRKTDPRIVETEPVAVDCLDKISVKGQTNAH